MCLAPTENDGMEKSDMDGENKERGTKRREEHSGNGPEKNIGTRVPPTISPTRIFTSARFLQSHFPCVNIHVPVGVYVHVQRVLFYFLPFIFLENARMCRKLLSIIDLH